MVHRQLPTNSDFLWSTQIPSARRCTFSSLSTASYCLRTAYFCDHQWAGLLGIASDLRQSRTRFSSSPEHSEIRLWQQICRWTSKTREKSTDLVGSWLVISYPHNWCTQLSWFKQSGTLKRSQHKIVACNTKSNDHHKSRRDICIAFSSMLDTCLLLGHDILMPRAWRGNTAEG